ncbi:hypothetical protein GCM10011533_15620 [Streptosporangium jomthongense]|uniref:DUF6746 family protein n=1 Tax=Marinobacter aromaticivorans TaxID=1494078 RepID=A0ABW2IUP4_9GAMM|nr:DUF6746 family protein [Marinobacter aromaticivorans]GGE64055.1 hypothetical protein GCM10011533_15620 [Streptosporangium jomthongense]
MTIVRNLTAVAASLLFAVPAFASEGDHFKGKPANTLEQAVANFSEYNNRLEDMLAGELGLEAMNEVHQLTYTLENALKKLDDEIDELEDTLEKVHKASEHADPDTVRSAGKQYLSDSRKIVR